MIFFGLFPYIYCTNATSTNLIQILPTNDSIQIPLEESYDNKSSSVLGRAPLAVWTLWRRERAQIRFLNYSNTTLYNMYTNNDQREMIYSTYLEIILMKPTIGAKLKSRLNRKGCNIKDEEGEKNELEAYNLTRIPTR